MYGSVDAISEFLSEDAVNVLQIIKPKMKFLNKIHI